jgi:hypothetical protein
MLAFTFDLGGYASALTTSLAAEIFWTIFVIGLASAILVLGRPKRPKRTWTYDLPPQMSRTMPHAEFHRSSRTRTRRLRG